MMPSPGVTLGDYLHDLLSVLEVPCFKSRLQCVLCFFFSVEKYQQYLPFFLPRGKRTA